MRKDILHEKCKMFMRTKRPPRSKNRKIEMVKKRAEETEMR